MGRMDALLGVADGDRQDRTAQVCVTAETWGGSHRSVE